MVTTSNLNTPAAASAGFLRSGNKIVNLQLIIIISLYNINQIIKAQKYGIFKGREIERESGTDAQ